MFDPSPKPDIFQSWDDNLDFFFHQKRQNSGSQSGAIFPQGGATATASDTATATAIVAGFYILLFCRE